MKVQANCNNLVGLDETVSLKQIRVYANRT
jgi:hypothetical protein